jgi:hypothetical protein
LASTSSWKIAESLGDARPETPGCNAVAAMSGSDQPLLDGLIHEHG